MATCVRRVEKKISDRTLIMRFLRSAASNEDLRSGATAR